LLCSAIVSRVSRPEKKPKTVLLAAEPVEFFPPGARSASTVPLRKSHRV